MPRPPRPSRTRALVLVMLSVLGACGDRSGKVLDDPTFPPPDPIVVASSVPATLTPEPTLAAPFGLIAPWVDGTAIPERHTCADAGLSPALTWSNVPPSTVELAVSVVDLDAEEFVHWLVYGIAPIETGLVEAAVPDAAFEWPNSSGQTGWAALCPPAGETHRYRFTVYALNQQLEAADDASAIEVLTILNATTIAQSSVHGIVTG